MDSPTIVLTGRRHGAHYRIDVAGQTLWLACGEFNALVKLFEAAFLKETGLTHLPRNDIYHLRRALDKQFGRGVGAQLIVVGGKGEYGLAMRKSKRRARLRVSKCFFELVEEHVISAETEEVLRKHCKIGRLRETEP